ncbi:hypothetical protein V497_07968 [Pseudogymnoascus sp. VKM F-4516 (FW-969)]|nr:hypothetical protein V497_07968 [Pseudogymnoascus sp. VKM F-4516 (FW-969)]
MHSILPIAALLAVCANAIGNVLEPYREYPNLVYLDSMCLSLAASSMANSPLPCDQRVYLENTCFANGTTPNDFIAEQQCLCGGNYYEAVSGCYACQIAHGLIVAPSDLATFSSEVSRLSTAECSASPVTQPYTNLFPSINATEYQETFTDLRLSSDNFPNDTRVENYWTGAATAVAGKITVEHQSSFTNTFGIRYTPTSAATTGGSVTTPSVPSSTEDAGAGAATSTGGAADVRVAGGLLAAVIGVLAVL